MTKDQRYSLNCVRVLAGYLRMEIDSDTLSTPEVKQLLEDVDGIEARYEQVLDDESEVRNARKKPPRKT